MENAVDALKISFAIFVFVMAITVLFSFTSQARHTADVILFYADDTNFYEHNSSSVFDRTVTTAEVISTLFRSYKESVCVTVDLNGPGQNNPTKIKTFDIKPGYADKKSIEREIKDFINNNVEMKVLNTAFIEKFVEVPISGIYQTGIDGSEITLSAGGKKVYITYTKQ